VATRGEDLLMKKRVDAALQDDATYLIVTSVIMVTLVILVVILAVHAA
jgi:hypothetical protein